MTLTHNDLEGLDLDWFAVDREGYIGHFATGGLGPVPHHLAMHDLQDLNEYCRKQLFFRCNAQESSGWESYAALRWHNGWKCGIETKDAKAREWYLSDFMGMAARGLFSFNVHGPFEYPAFYHRVAVPSIPLRANDLPQTIQDKLCRAAFPNLCFATDKEVHREQLGDVVA